MKYVRLLSAGGVSLCLFATSALAAGCKPPMEPTTMPGVCSFPVPPAGFTPETASDAQLQAYGLPKHPTDQAELPIWESIVHATSGRIVPEFRVTSEKNEPAGDGFHTSAGNISFSNWSGAALVAPNSAVFDKVAGLFQIPAVSAPAACSTLSSSILPGFLSSDWVGIDGLQNKFSIQAGIANNVLCPSLANQIFPWWEWVPDFQIAIPNLSVAAGDTMYVAVAVINDQIIPPLGAANFFLMNLRSGQSVAFQVKNPNAAPDYTGTSAEWIHEATSECTSPTNCQVSPLPAFAGVTFFQQRALNVFGDVSVTGTFVHGGVELSGNEFQVTMKQGNRTVSTPFPLSDKATWILGTIGVGEVVGCGEFHIGEGC